MQWLSKLFAPSFDWIQVEVTSHCNVECVYCPHTVYRDFWQSISMPMEMYEKLAQAFKRTSLVYLQGWGEPLLHPQFFDMVRVARHCGCRVGTTTNGMLVGEEVAERMVSEGLSIVGFSLAGTGEFQDTIRHGTRLKNVLLAVQRLDEAKKRAGSSLPEIHVAYMWLSSQFRVVRALPALLEEKGVRQVVVSTLDFVPHRDLSEESIQAQGIEEEAFLKGIVSEVIEDGARRGMDIAFRLVAPYRMHNSCTENVTKALFVSSRGLVSPCVFRNLPIQERLGWKMMGLTAPASLIFGDVNDRSLTEIWKDKHYQAFRKDHTRGRATHACGACPKLYCLVQE